MKSHIATAIVIGLFTALHPVLGHCGCVSGDCKNGTGTFNFKDGSVYIGQFQNGQLTGEGAYTFPDGAKQIGIFNNGIFDKDNPEAKLHFSSVEQCVKAGECSLYSDNSDPMIQISEKVYYIKGAVEIFDRKQYPGKTSLSLVHGTKKSINRIGFDTKYNYEFGRTIDTITLEGYSEADIRRARQKVENEKNNYASNYYWQPSEGYQDSQSYSDSTAIEQLRKEFRRDRLDAEKSQREAQRLDCDSSCRERWYSCRSRCLSNISSTQSGNPNQFMSSYNQRQNCLSECDNENTRCGFSCRKY